MTDARGDDAATFRALFGLPTVGIKRIALDGRLLAANRALCDLLGYAEADLLRLHVADITHPDDLAREIERIEPVLAGTARGYVVEKRQRYSSGASLWVRVSGALVQDPVSPEPTLVAVVEPIVARRRDVQRLEALQAELLQVARSSALGQLAAALAHEINQPLTAAGNYISACRRLATRDNLPSEPVIDALEKASRQMARAGEIVHRLRRLIETGEAPRVPHDINRTVEDSCALALVGTRPAEIEVRFELAAALPPVVIDKIQVQQVIVNLLRNAVEAMTRVERRRITLATSRHADGFVEVAIGDTGPGLPAEVAQRLFQPFVSTKSGAMGVGLAICRTFVVAHGGTIAAEPHQDGGTVFRFTLPAAGPGDS